MNMFKTATRSQARLRLGLIGPAGSGKTMTALRIASGLGGKVAVIDTERGSASLYAGERGLAFDVLELETYGVELFVEAINGAAQSGYSVLVIDSLSHAWAGKDGILEFVDKAGKRSQTGGNFAAWRDATPRHNELVDAILGAPMHVICTLRSKVEYVVENVGGRNQVRKVGLQPVQRDGLEYEFTVVGDVTQDHDLVVTKTRAAWLKDAVIREAGEDLGRRLAEWIAAGEPQPMAVHHVQRFEPPTKTGLLEQIQDVIRQASTLATLGKISDRMDLRLSDGSLSRDDYELLTAALSQKHDEIEPQRAAS